MAAPSITLAQIVAALMAAILPVLTLVGVDLSREQVDALQQLTDLAMALVGADAAIRVGRAFNIDGVLKAKAIDALAKTTAETPQTPPSGGGA